MVANASSVPYRDQGMFKSWGKDTLPDQDESEQLKLWRDKCAKAKKRVSTPPVIPLTKHLPVPGNVLQGYQVLTG